MNLNVILVTKNKIPSKVTLDEGEMALFKNRTIGKVSVHVVSDFNDGNQSDDFTLHRYCKSFAFGGLFNKTIFCPELRELREESDVLIYATDDEDYDNNEIEFRKELHLKIDDWKKVVIVFYDSSFKSIGDIINRANDAVIPQHPLSGGALEKHHFGDIYTPECQYIIKILRHANYMLHLYGLCGFLIKKPDERKRIVRSELSANVYSPYHTPIMLLIDAYSLTPACVNDSVEYSFINADDYRYVVSDNLHRIMYLFAVNNKIVETNIDEIPIYKLCAEIEGFLSDKCNSENSTEECSSESDSD